MYYHENSFEAGRVIIALKNNCIYPNMPTCNDDPLFDGIDAKRIDVLFHPKCTNNEDDIGAILLINLECKEKTAVIQTIEKLKANPCVVFAEPDYFLGAHLTPDDPYFRYLWGMDNIKSSLAWNYTTGSPDVVVGVIDSGIDYNHSDMIDNMWSAPDGQGIFGWDFNDDSDNPIDLTGHGTHVAGTIGAVGNNHIGVTGVCWKVKMASLKIGNAFFNVAAAIQAIDYANENKIPILNNSWGSRSYSASLKFAIEHYDGLFIVSAGNSGSNNDIYPIYPASYDSENIITVAATYPSNFLSYFSNYGATSVDIAAPGVDILSTALYNEYSYMSGTSMAAPHVSGAAALLKGYIPSLTALEMKSLILSSADQQPQLQNKILTKGTLNINKMIEMASSKYG